MTNTELITLVVYLFVALGTAVLWHWYAKRYWLASLAAATTITLFGEVASYIELGFRSTWSNVALVFGFLYGLIFSLLVGVPFAVKRKRWKA
jgi:hypothetical protein